MNNSETESIAGETAGPPVSQPVRETYISVLKIICCLSVIILHMNGVFWLRPHGKLWVSANFLETFFYFAVPVFFMISGATLLDYRERYSTKEFLKKRFSKTITPFIFWSVAAGLFNAWMNGQSFDYNIAHVIDNIVNTRYFSIYWFFTSLFAVYLSMPLLSAVSDKLRVYGFTAAVGVICLGIIPLCFSLLGLGDWPITPPVVGGYIIYVLLGYIFSKLDLSQKQRNIVYKLGIAGWLLHFAGTLYLSLEKNEINETFKGYLNIPAILQAIAVFVFFKNLNYEKLCGKHPVIEKGINTLASYTFGIYLLHMFPVTYLPNRYPIDTSSLGWRLGAVLPIFAVCAIVTGIVKKIPIIKKLLP